MLQFEVNEERHAQIKVIGIGGGGSNAVNRMIESGMKGSLLLLLIRTSRPYPCQRRKPRFRSEEAYERIRRRSKSEIGQRAAEESIDDLTKLLMGSDMVFITAGMGGAPARCSTDY